ncbi:hypothetical protein BH24ACT26_BH24ACT26_14370 [soil metagenome]
MTDDLRPILQRLAPKPPRPVDVHALMAEGKKRRRTRVAIGSATLVLLATAAIIPVRLALEESRDGPVQPAIDRPTPSETVDDNVAIRVWQNLRPGWTKLAPPPEPRTDPVSVWTAREGAVELFLWGGYTGYGGSVHADGFAWSPDTNDWRRLPDAPLAPHSRAGAVFTGSEVIVWGGYGSNQESLGDGAAYDIAADSWRSIAEAPITARAPLSTIWTGREMIVWGSYERPSGQADGAAYDPSDDTWRPIARAPRSLDLATTVWTGDEMVVFGALLDNNNASRTDHAVGLAYDPESDSWRELAPSQLSPQASAIAWTGSEVIAWDYGLRAAAYNPTKDRWRSLPDVPLKSYECYPASVDIGSFVMAWFCGQAALWDFADGGWRKIPTPEAVVPGRPVAAGEVVFFAGAAHESEYSSLWVYAPPAD